MSTISLKQIRKSYGKTEVIHGIDAEIADGEFIVIVGPSGCGKSTLLRMVAGLETVTSGEIAIDGKRVNDLEPMDRNIAMVFQSYALYPHMSVFDNMAYGLKIAGTPKAEIAERVARAAEMLQLQEFLQRRPRELSGGQRQRVAMGRAIVRKPAAFLFDEPLSNLDAKLRVQMRLEIKGLQRDLGVTSLYVTHDQVEAMTLADRMIVMNAGVAEQIGAPLDVYRDPQTVFVGGFIGSPPMNFVAPAVLAANGTALPEALSRAVKGNGDGALVGMRPEHMTLTSGRDAMLKGTMRYVEPLGAETLVHLALEDGTQVTVRQEGIAEVPEPGAACHVRCDPDYLCLFDSAGQRVALSA
ncbi:sn-glycerol-3-phosphate ABC transporter ATP-binding protein UgpC [Nitratireductor mangrovi]|uniref:Sn-glycerol-3-phosphate ABC transporter ATP-binding protein UgpC n=1 Tax=Nitratireductor mangrovi TaxID=2599600 RepID=A0A5B8L4Z0_9HYPH|nr:sn-glycerol-3-phosphate ABC transporter ATP-binding protein UgpC [Nitratireductor mangrovi]QDZ03071.1 sn-glycerol-3-phosphate ABC transporter ATP-binding protein UgpC [Nitratireductor mangrovi]